MRSQAAFERQKPAITGSRAGRRLVQRSDKKTQPKLRRPRVRVREHKHFAAQIGCTHSHAQVVNFLSAVGRWSSDASLNNWTSQVVICSPRFFNYRECRIVGGIAYKNDLKRRIVLRE